MEKWSKLEKGLARALLSHPELAADAVILTKLDPPVLNKELNDFMVGLDEAMRRHPDDTNEALMTVPIRKDGVMRHLIFEVYYLPPRHDYDEVVDLWNSEQVLKDSIAKKNPALLARARANLKVVE